MGLALKGGGQTKGPWKLISYKEQTMCPKYNLSSNMSQTYRPISIKMVFCIIDALQDFLQEVKGGPKYVMGPQISVKKYQSKNFIQTILLKKNFTKFIFFFFFEKFHLTNFIQKILLEKFYSENFTWKISLKNWT